MKTRPCSTCETIIQETANVFDEDEDAWEPFDDEEFPEEDFDLLPSNDQHKWESLK